jgi:hypothetical protein
LPNADWKSAKHKKEHTAQLLDKGIKIRKSCNRDFYGIIWKNMAEPDRPQQRT